MFALVLYTSQAGSTPDRSTNFMADDTDDTWKTLFEVKYRHERDGSAMAYDGCIKILEYYDIINIHNGLTIGSYRNRLYAIKQARRKYKKLVRLMEKSFMTLT
jgi:hypothetical protein